MVSACSNIALANANSKLHQVWVLAIRCLWDNVGCLRAPGCDWVEVLRLKCNSWGGRGGGGGCLLMDDWSSLTVWPLKPHVCIVGLVQLAIALLSLYTDCYIQFVYMYLSTMHWSTVAIPQVSGHLWRTAWESGVLWAAAQTFGPPSGLYEHLALLTTLYEHLVPLSSTIIRYMYIYSGLHAYAVVTPR